MNNTATNARAPGEGASLVPACGRIEWVGANNPMKYVVYIQYQDCPQLRLVIEADCEEAARNIALEKYNGCRVITADILD